MAAHVVNSTYNWEVYKFTRIYNDVMGVNLKFFKEKVKKSDRNVSTVVLRACILCLKHFL